MRVLIVDHEPSTRRTLRAVLEATGHTVAEAESGPSAVRQAERSPYDAALVDVRLASESGLDLIERLHRGHPRLAGVVITAQATVATAIEAFRRGAFDFLPKPFTPEQVGIVLERLSRVRSLEVRVAELEDLVRNELPEIAHESLDPLVQRVMNQARVVAPTEAVVLIRGAKGTGKGVLARMLHAWSNRAEGPLVTVSCPCLDPELLESDLFGYAPGALTDAVRDASGKLATAEGGTLFLDEVGELPPALQFDLLRLLQDRTYERVGESGTRTADVRIIAATRCDLEAAVRTGTFLSQLLNRLNVVELTLPPLRLRSDIAVLSDNLLAFFARQSGRRLTGFTPEARESLARYHWPGNLRELRNAVERAAILAPGPTVEPTDLPEAIARPRPCVLGPVEVGRRISLDVLEAEHIRRVLASTANLEEAAKVLRIDPSTLYRKRKRLGL